MTNTQSVNYGTWQDSLIMVIRYASPELAYQAAICLYRTARECGLFGNGRNQGNN